MNLRGIKFAPVLAQSGLMNLTGRPYWYRLLFAPMLAMPYRKMTFVSKTTTLEERAGNMPLGPDGETPVEWMPKCIWADPFKGITLNAVGLSGPGLVALLRTNRWQQRRDPFWISVMSVASSREERLREFREMVEILFAAKKTFAAPFGLQVNLSCPNQNGVTEAQALDEAQAVLNIVAQLGVPVMIKLSVTTSPAQALLIAEHPACDAVCISNTVPFGKLEDVIDWHALFGIPRDEAITDQHSPLFGRVGFAGGLSGPPLQPLVLEWVIEARRIGMKKHINAGGGLFSVGDVRRLVDAGADSLSFGTVCMQRPWRVRGMMNCALRLLA